MIVETHHRSSNLNGNIKLFLEQRHYPLISSLFIVVFLLLFQPFQIQHTALPTLIASFINLIFVHTILFYLFSFLALSKRLPRNQYLQLLLFVFAVGICSQTTHILLGFSTFKIHKTLEWMYASFLVIPIPHLIKIWGFNISLFTQPPEVLSFHGVVIDRIGFLKAMENYVEIWYEEKGQIQHQLVRTTMNSGEQTLSPEFMRCHRSYLVNRKNIRSISANSRGGTLVLSLGTQTFEIPISGKKLDEFRQFQH